MNILALTYVDVFTIVGVGSILAVLLTELWRSEHDPPPGVPVFEPTPESLVPPQQSQDALNKPAAIATFAVGKQIWSEDDALVYDREKLPAAWQRLFHEPLPRESVATFDDQGDTFYELKANGYIAGYCCGLGFICEAHHAD